MAPALLLLPNSVRVAQWVSSNEATQHTLAIVLAVCAIWLLDISMNVCMCILRLVLVDLFTPVRCTSIDAPVDKRALTLAST